MGVPAYKNWYSISEEWEADSNVYYLRGDWKRERQKALREAEQARRALERNIERQRSWQQREIAVARTETFLELAGATPLFAEHYLAWLKDYVTGGGVPKLTRRAYPFPGQYAATDYRESAIWLLSNPDLSPNDMPAGYHRFGNAVQVMLDPVQTKFRRQFSLAVCTEAVGDQEPEQTAYDSQGPYLGARENRVFGDSNVLMPQVTHAPGRITRFGRRRPVVELAYATQPQSVYIYAGQLTILQSMLSGNSQAMHQLDLLELGARSGQ